MSDDDFVIVGISGTGLTLGIMAAAAGVDLSGAIGISLAVFISIGVVIIRESYKNQGYSKFFRGSESKSESRPAEYVSIEVPRSAPSKLSV